MTMQSQSCIHKNHALEDTGCCLSYLFIINQAVGLLVGTENKELWQSQINNDKNQQHLPTNNKKSIRLSHHSDEIIISIPNFHHVTPYLKIFTSAKDVILFRFVTNEYVVINQSNTIMNEQTLFNEDSIPVHVLHLSTCTTLENTSTSSETQFPASQDLFSLAEEGLDGSCDLFSNLSAAGNSNCVKEKNSDQ